MTGGTEAAARCSKTAGVAQGAPQRAAKVPPMTLLRRTLALLLVLTVGAVGPPALAETDGAGCAGGGSVDGPSSASEVVEARTFYVNVVPKRRVYERGDTAALSIAVSRPAREDPAGQGIPMDGPASEPASGVSLVAIVSVGDALLFDTAETNEDGRATVRIKIKNATPRGRVDIEIGATKIVVETPCATVKEVGYFERKGFFRVR